MNAKKLYILLFSLILANFSYSQQKVGLVLSGGGATGLAHIGVLKALEENGIPVDYITGTSAGALIGSMYAAGWSPEEMEAYVLSEEFQIMAKGDTKPNHHFLLRKEDDNAGMVNFSFSKDSILKKSLPTNFTSSSYLDLQMMNLLGTASASYHKDFDSLFVPYRCVASDIAKKKSVIFKSGNLNEAVRASMTYPFYFKPIRIDDVLLFDGGLYNNFPTDVMYDDFSPDYIIGSNVGYNADLPDENDLIGQLTNMLVAYSDYSLPCQDGFIIEPQTNISTFNFGAAEQAIQDGYAATVKIIDSIKPYLNDSISKEELTKRRKAFRASIPDVNVSSVETTSDNGYILYSRRALIKRTKYERLTFKDIERRYFRLYAAPQVDFVYPTLTLKNDSTYSMKVNVRKSKDFKIEVGGHLSSRPVNTGYFGITYQTIGKVLTQTKFESYFGNFYGSAKGSFKLDLPAVYPISTTAYFTLNRWDYFRSFATFFEDVQPSFLVQNEMYTGVKLDLPISNTVLSSIDGRVFKLDDEYYQTDDFTNKDTTDITNFNGLSVSWNVTQNSLNRKQFANSGHLFSFKMRYIYGREHSTSGSTAITPYDEIRMHQWLNLSLDVQSFVIDHPHFHFGVHGQMVYNSQTLFANYTASLLSMTEFSLIPDAKTYFLPEYRSPQFIGIGINTIFSINKKIDIRFDGYLYQPFVQVIQNDDGTLMLSKPFKGETYMASGSIIYHSFIGPVRFTTNFFPKQDVPFAFQVSLGYVLFNERAIR